MEFLNALLSFLLIFLLSIDLYFRYVDAHRNTEVPNMLDTGMYSVIDDTKNEKLEISDVKSEPGRALEDWKKEYNEKLSGHNRFMADLSHCITDEFMDKRGLQRRLEVVVNRYLATEKEDA